MPAAIARIEEVFAPEAVSRDETNGLSLSFEDWHFNLRASNTEPLLRLNVEARGDAGLVVAKVAEIRSLLGDEIG